MLLDQQNFGGGHSGPWCSACRQPIAEGQKSVNVHFQTDPQGHKGLSGAYHAECSRPFVSMARIINLNPFAGR